MPVPMQPYYKHLGVELKHNSHYRSYYEECLSIPIYYSLSDSEQEYVISTIKDIISKKYYIVFNALCRLYHQAFCCPLLQI